MGAVQCKIYCPPSRPMQNFAKIFVFKTEDGRPNINSDARLPSNAPHLSKNFTRGGAAYRSDAQ